MNIENTLQQNLQLAFQTLFNLTVEIPLDSIAQPSDANVTATHTFVTFPYAKMLQKSPVEVATQLGEFLQKNTPIIQTFEVVKGFLNLTVKDEVWLPKLTHILQDANYGTYPPNSKKIMVEYSSPNTNKPLHLGHLRNNFLGYALAQILANNGYTVTKATLINDRGIHICKSMLAYEKFGKAETPQTANLKGDHLVGYYYVRFDKELKEQAAPLLAMVANNDLTNFPVAAQGEISKLIEKIKKLEEDPEKNKKKIVELQGDIKQLVQNQTPIMKEAQQMLKKWEQGDEAVMSLWKKMNNWVYGGFAQTYQDIGVSFDKAYYESETYLLGKTVVEEGLQKGIFYKKEDNSVWIDLTAEGLDHKLVLRGDGTSVYITQDLGTADLKYEEYQLDKSIYVIGNEQDYHLKVLFAILKKLNRPYANGLYHLSYGMVELPEGKGRIKSREGTVVDADNLLEEVIEVAKQRTTDAGKIEELSEKEAEDLFKILALGALKYFLLKIDPTKRIVFNPEESVEFQGDTGVFIQYTYVRTAALLRKAQQVGITTFDFKNYTTLQKTEKAVLQHIEKYPKKVWEAGENYAPSIIAQYAYELARLYSTFYADLSIFNAESTEAKHFRLALTQAVGKILQKSLGLLGIQVPERM